MARPWRALQPIWCSHLVNENLFNGTDEHPSAAVTCRAVLRARAAGVEEVLGVRRDMLPPAMSNAVIDPWPQAHWHSPSRIGPAKRNVELTLTVLFSFALTIM
jgi:hypothetical protein